MTYFPDLSLYSYTRYPRWALNVGWLDGTHDFDREPPSERLLDALWDFVRFPLVQTRGRHQCEICPRAWDFDERVEEVGRRVRDPADPLHSMPMGEVPWPEMLGVDRIRRVATARNS